MSILGEPLAIDITPKIVGYMAANGPGSTQQVIGSSSYTQVYHYFSDNQYFTSSSGAFTCKKAGTYRFKLYIRGSYNSSGTQCYARFRLYKNGTAFYSVTSGSTYGNGGGLLNITEDFAINDVLTAMVYANTGNIGTSLVIVIETTPQQYTGSSNGIIGNSLTVKRTPDMVAYLTARSMGSDQIIIGSSSYTGTYMGNADSRYFAYSSGAYTCKHAGTYKIQIYGRGAYTTAGNLRYAYFRLYKNGTAFYSVTSGSAYPNAGGTNSTTVTLAVGDVLTAMVYVSNNNNIACQISLLLRPN